MKAIFVAIVAFALSSQAIAYDRNRSIGEEWQQQRGTAESQRIEEAVRQRESEHNARMQQLDRLQKARQQENEWRQRQLDVEQYRLWLWSR